VSIHCGESRRFVAASAVKVSPQPCLRQDDENGYGAAFGSRRRGVKRVARGSGAMGSFGTSSERPHRCSYGALRRTGDFKPPGIRFSRSDLDEFVRHASAWRQVRVGVVIRSSERRPSREPVVRRATSEYHGALTASHCNASRPRGPATPPYGTPVETAQSRSPAAATKTLE
jgi:hypothetical protein